MPLRLIDQIRSHARGRPGSPAVRQIIPSDGRMYSWAELNDRVERIAAALKRAFSPGAVFMLCSANGGEFIATFLAALAAEMHVFPIAPDIAGLELASAGQRAGAAGILAIGQPSLPVAGVFGRARPMVECAADAMLHDLPTWEVKRLDGAGLLLLSSGTTGRPKIVRRPGESLDAVAQNMVNAIGFTATDRVLAAVPLYHSYGMEHGLLCPMWAGSCTHLYDRFDLPAAIDELTSGRVSIFPGVPFMFETLAGGAGQSADGPLPLRLAYSAGGPLPKSLFDLFLARFSIPIAQLYGATEIGSVTFNHPRIEPFDPASVGRAMEAVSIKILDPAVPDVGRTLPIGAEGHIAISAPSMLAEYIDSEPPPLADGHFLTGDLGRLDESGALRITGRIKLLIDVAGRKVNPLEVEAVLASHPAVSECVVVPVRMSETLCRLRAVIVPVPGAAPPHIAELRQFARERLSAYKVPRVFEMRATLPRSSAGKVLRNVLEAESR